ncbi:NAD(P)-binding protein [Karstenula rhodostoma CBS 690.94]|uniref:NAD(P)-binding protein n=1 Tax=Karstenula rhodostoma CBS 690.94 TaxID=1392251 RepID=A0A9P4U6E3_9PLEO|nr:NAD(P)-binding protein [Karstenula rhodostoma CBS 690.94]
MKIAITGARGTVGQDVVKSAVDAGHSVVQINRTEQKPDDTPNSEFRTADTANDYDATYFPIDEDYPPNPTDAYALAKIQAEMQAKAFVNWFPGTKIACLRIHEVAPKKDVQKEHEENWEAAAVGQLWAWVSPAAVARACLLSVEKADSYEGCGVFNIVAPETTQKTTSAELAKKYYPDAEVRSGLEGNKGFWTIDKAEKVLGWKHEEKQ